MIKGIRLKLEEIEEEAEDEEVDTSGLEEAKHIPVHTVSSANYLQLVGALEESGTACPLYTDILLLNLVCLPCLTIGYI